MKRSSGEQLAAIKRYLKETSGFAHKPVEQIRKEMEGAAEASPSPAGVAVHEAAIGHLNGEWIVPDGLATSDEDRVILYFHGGGFIAGTCAFYRGLCAAIAKSSGVKVLVVEYRLAPEHPYPAANEDCLSAYRWLLARGFAARKIMFGGDSVGATLVLMTLISLRDQAAELSAGAFCISPHTDLVHLDGESYRSRAALDPTGSLEGSKRILADYLGGRSEKIPLLSPLRLDLQGLPALFIHAGDHEVLLSDSIRFADRAKLAGVEVQLEIWDNMWGVFQFLANMLPEAKRAIDHIGRFVRATLMTPGPAGDGEDRANAL